MKINSIQDKDIIIKYSNVEMKNRCYATTLTINDEIFL